MGSILTIGMENEYYKSREYTFREWNEVEVESNHQKYSRELKLTYATLSSNEFQIANCGVVVDVDLPRLNSDRGWLCERF